MNGICTPFTNSDQLKSTVRALTAKVADLWTQHVAPERDYDKRDNVILVNMGHWLEQSSYVDRTGYFITIRLHPLYNHLPRVQESARAVLGSFLALFPGHTAAHYEGRENLEGGTGNITLVVETGMFSIGD